MKQDLSNDDTHIRTLVEQMDKIELVDLEQTDAINEEVVTQYLSSLYNDLLDRSEARDKGIPRVVLTDVKI
jgi:hypothetical protein